MAPRVPRKGTKWLCLKDMYQHGTWKTCVALVLQILGHSQLQTEPHPPSGQRLGPVKAAGAAPRSPAKEAIHRKPSGPMSANEPKANRPFNLLVSHDGFQFLVIPRVGPLLAKVPKGDHLWFGFHWARESPLVESRGLQVRVQVSSMLP